ncbi:methyltransferase [Actinophytocola sp.]|uniref:methyltransferase n=1 Tax=Actinophytocola sp. TaxID=1872138 RepID=UPI002D7FFC4C|nr:methyltransferase [Actinophytocola sp.]HET9143113.1 methyltransferase [Actinophytocola sp.]
MAHDPGLEARVRMAADLLTPMVIRVAATLRLADHIADGARTCAALAKVTDSDEDALGRVLGHLVMAGFLVRQDGDGFGLTGLGEVLRGDDSRDVRAWLDLDGATGHADLCLVELLHTVRTGRPAFAKRYGRTFWEELAADPELSASFDALMSSQEIGHPAVAAAYDWGALGTVVDVGGGNGSLLVALLTRYPGLRATLVELDAPATRARAAFAAAGVADRTEVVTGSFFRPLPPGAGGYVLSSVIHDWDDDAALAILRRCATAAGSNGKVILIEQTQSQGGKSARTAMDLRMLAYFRGRERGLDDIAELAAAAGLTVIAVHPVEFRSVIELRTHR